jgi:hypothetical protein
MIKNPFQNEEETFKIDQLTVENRLDRVQIYGSVDITRDKIGLGRVKELQVLINSVVAALSSEDLPDTVTVEEPTIIKNPFN